MSGACDMVAYAMGVSELGKSRREISGSTVTHLKGWTR